MKRAIASAVLILGMLSALIPLTAWQNTPTIGVLPDSGPALPATCVIGQLYFKTTATIGLNQCTATNTWTAVGGGSATSCGSPTCTVSTAGGGNGVLALSGNTSGTATLTAPSVAGTITNPIAFSNAISIPDSTTASTTSGGITVGTAAHQVIIGTGSNLQSSLCNANCSGIAFGNNSMWYNDGGNNGQLAIGAGSGMGNVTWRFDTLGAGGTTGHDLLAINNRYVRSSGSCNVIADITLPVNTATNVCSFTLPAIAYTWSFQCKIPWVISAGTGTNTIAIAVNPQQTPAATTGAMAEIKSTNTNTATEAYANFSTSGATTILTSGTITPSATVFQSEISGTLSAPATSGTFAIQMTAAGTTATAAAKAGATCWLY